MADFDYNGYEDSIDQADYPRGTGFARMISVIGGLASLALVAGVGVWAYQLMMRDVSGVPVVRAVEGPMRIQPENPGGRPADHQGLAVNSVAAVGAAEKPADRLMLAPKPVELDEEDQPLAQELTAQAAPAPEAEQGVDTAAVDALVAQLVASAEPLEVLTPAQTESVNVSSETGAAVLQNAVLEGPGLPRSLRPQIRPIKLDVQPVAAVARSASARDVDAASLPVGTRLAQLGAFETADLAKLEWDRLSDQFSDYMSGKSRVIQEASSGGRVFFRLRAAGFEDIADARRFCAVLIAERADCIPVTIR